MLSVKAFFRMMLDVDVTEKRGDIHTDVTLGFRDKEDVPVEVNTPIVLQSIAVGLFLVWKKYGYILNNMPADHFCQFFHELLDEVFQTKLRELEQKANEEGDGGEVVNLAKHRLEGNRDGKI